jgi:hypothetical protein
VIVAAALRMIDGTVRSLAPPARHVDIEIVCRQAGINVLGADKGFVLDDARWARRKPAARHAVQCGQVDGEKINWNLGLFTEDLW